MSEAEDKPNGTGQGREPDARQELFRREDTWAIMIAGLLVLVGATLHFLPLESDLAAEFNRIESALEAEEIRSPAFRTLDWHRIANERMKLVGTTHPAAKSISAWLPKLQKWKSSPLEAVFLDEETAEARNASAREKLTALEPGSQSIAAVADAAERAAANAEFKDATLNERAATAIGEHRKQLALERVAKKKAAGKPYSQIPNLIAFGVIATILFGIAARFIGGSAIAFIRGFGFVYLLAIFAYALAAQSDVKSAGFGYAAWAILLGLLVSNTVGTPRWLAPAAQAELFIKTGLVLLGVEILFGKILVIGLPGIFVAWVVTPIVFVTTYLFGQKILKISSRSLNLTLSADMSVCGVSAAIATAAACRARKEELTLAVGISMVFTSIMMIVMPNVIQLLGIDPVIGGAWIGGTIDATGAVAAAGAYLGDDALYVAATIKMIQNILIGVIAFCVAVFWVTRVERSGAGPRPSLWDIWHRFPKFVLGFVAASIVFWIIYEAIGGDEGERVISNGLIKGWTKSIRGWLFCLAFVSIGLATDFRNLGTYLRGGKPVVLYVCGQALNILLTLGAAYLMFRVVFPTASEGL